MDADTNKQVPRGSIRREEPTAEDLDAVRLSVDKWAAGAEGVQRAKAVRMLVRAINDFRFVHYFATGEPDGRRSKFRHRNDVASTRGALAELSEKLGDCLRSVERLQGAPEAMVLLCAKAKKPHGALKRHLASMSEIADELTQWKEAAGSAYIAATRLPDRPSDSARTQLAAEVAYVLSRVLDVEPTGTRDPEKAAYAAILVTVLHAAGSPVPGELKDIIEQGRERWRTLEEIRGG